MNTLMIIVFVADAIRWWGAMAGMINAADVAQHFIAKKRGDESILDGVDWNHPLLVLLISLFLILAGLTIPLTHFVPGFKESTAFFGVVMCFAWYVISLVGWYIAVKISKSKTYMIWTSCLSLPILIIASYMSGV